MTDLFLFNPTEEDVEANKEHLPLVKVVRSWRELGALLN